MPQLTPIQLEDGTLIYIQTVENISVPTPEPNIPEKTPTSDDSLDFIITEPQQPATRDFPGQQRVSKSFTAIEKTVRAYTLHLLNSFKNLAIAEVSEVTLEFGINVGGMTGIPYIATGNTDCNVKISVKCTFPKQKQT
ncbi:MAG: CU044_2847 family protein [Cyanobacteriota bacterium]|nr:CU044_2847 family protein [Cyanobacteriota bacterium]